MDQNEGMRIKLQGIIDTCNTIIEELDASVLSSKPKYWAMASMCGKIEQDSNYVKQRIFDLLYDR